MTLTRTRTRFMAIILTVMTLFSTLSISASAAKVCQQVTGTPKAKTTFTVKTTSRWLLSDKITFTQSKGTASFKNWVGVDKNRSTYAAYNITYSKIVNGKVVSTKSETWKDSSHTIKLDKNSTYKITVSPISTDYYTLRMHPTWGAFNNWVKTPQWSVKNTKGINSCSFIK